MVKEKYYAVRIGNPRKHRTYLMLGDDMKTPQLFCSPGAAQDAAIKRVQNKTECKVVAVNVCETRSI